MIKEDFDIPIPIMVVALAIVISIALYIFVGFTQYPSVARFLEAHGSLIAGMLGIIGVFILVWNQNQSTKKTVDATLHAIQLESFEIKRRQNISDLIDVMTIMDTINFDKPSCIESKDIDFIRTKVQKLSFLGFRETSKRMAFLFDFFIFFTELHENAKTHYRLPIPNTLKILNQQRVGLISELKLAKKEVLLQEGEGYSCDYIDDLLYFFSHEITLFSVGTRNPYPYQFSNDYIDKIYSLAGDSVFLFASVLQCQKSVKPNNISFMSI